MKHDAHQNLEPDIQAALDATDVPPGGADSSASPMLWLSQAVVVPMPLTSNPFILGVWMLQNAALGLKQILLKIASFAGQNPLLALAGVVAALGCGWLCPYFGTMVAGGAVWWCVKRG